MDGSRGAHAVGECGWRGRPRAFKLPTLCLTDLVCLNVLFEKFNSVLDWDHGCETSVLTRSGTSFSSVAVWVDDADGEVVVHFGQFPAAVLFAV